MPTEPRGDEAAWTVLKTVQWTVAYFKRQGLESPRVDAETLLAHTLGCQRIDLYLRHDQPLNSDELRDFKQSIKRRSQHEPVAFITGEKEFWSLRFQVTPDVLIPRPDTECLVEHALRHLPDADTVANTLLELGTGSGAISVVLAHERPRLRCLATDRSWLPVQTARNNARHHRVEDRLTFMVGHWLEALTADRHLFDIIVTNPPYIRTGDLERLPTDIYQFEPIVALDGGQDGLGAIRQIVSQAHRRLKAGGVLFIEIAHDQCSAVADLVRQVDAYDHIVCHKDLGGHDRVVQIHKR
ncbi:MAG: peptide chain release factor N(5)-glutamine methyltransferase [Desulfatitalea sp.]|nr:peptide chain release factor N(5)-glutamine methyltransferase [Desulfatitalea sp.]NNK02321.1 peptide chain release factor N(5)-glutamine methyltransferase [Desulfatitalea sp.]